MRGDPGLLQTTVIFEDVTFFDDLAVKRSVLGCHMCPEANLESLTLGTADGTASLAII